MNHSQLEGNKGRGGLWRPFERNNCGLYISIYTALTLSKLTFLSGNQRKKGPEERQKSLTDGDRINKNGKTRACYQSSGQLSGRLSWRKKERDCGERRVGIIQHTHKNTLLSQNLVWSVTFDKMIRREPMCAVPHYNEFGQEDFVAQLRILLIIT